MIERYLKLKRIYGFLAKKTALAITISIFILVVSSAGVIYNSENVSLIISFGFSIVVCLTIFEWKNGKIPFVMSDRIWSALWYKEYDDRKETHKKIMLVAATFSFSVMILTFLIGILWLILSETIFV